MKRIISILLIFVLMLPSFAWAEPQLPTVTALPNEISVGPAVSPMKKGQTAPFSGVLLSPEAVAKVIVDYNNQKAQSQIEIDRAKELQKAQDQLVIDNLVADLKREKEVAEAGRKSSSEQLQILNKRIEEAEKNKPNVAIVAGLGAAAGAALVILTIVLTNAANK